MLGSFSVFMSSITENLLHVLVFQDFNTCFGFEITLESNDIAG